MSMAKSLVMDLTSTAILKTISSSIREDQKTVAAIEAFKIIMMTVAESQAAEIRRAMTNLVANAQTVIAVEAKAEAAADPTKMTQEAMDPDYLTAIEISILSMIDVHSVISLCVKLFDINRGSLFIIKFRYIDFVIYNIKLIFANLNGSERSWTHDDSLRMRIPGYSSVHLWYH